MPQVAVEPFVPVIERADATGRFIFVCEHASNHIPSAYGTLGLDEDQRRAHIAWDPGALGVARRLADLLSGVLIHAPVSRLIYDCNRAPDMAGAMPTRSELHDIPGNTALSVQERLARTEAVYLPWVSTLHSLIARRIASGLNPVVVTIHSFTPVYFGKKRLVEFGIIHDEDRSLSVAVLTAAQKLTRLNAQLNAPYSAADDVTHTLRLHATPYGLPNVMPELRNDLIATPDAQETMAAQLAPVLNMGLAEIQKQAKAS